MKGTVAIASDHAGLRLRAEVVAAARAAGWEVLDLGAHTAERTDYPDWARAGCEKVLSGEARFAILVCGTGIGMSISANKLHGIRAALCVTEFEARLARQHNDANVLCLGERVLGPGLATAVVSAFFDAQFEGGRHAQRVAKIAALER